MSCLDKNVRNQPACRARSASRSKTRVRVRGALATGGWEPTGAWCLWTCTLVIDPLFWERRVGEKETEHLMLESIERASGWVVARRRRRLVTCRPSCLHKDWVLRLRFASPQNIDCWTGPGNYAVFGNFRQFLYTRFRHQLWETARRKDPKYPLLSFIRSGVLRVSPHTASNLSCLRSPVILNDTHPSLRRAFLARISAYAKTIVHIRIYVGNMTFLKNIYYSTARTSSRKTRIATIKR